jgi:lambda family phage minor tail protein L
LSITSEIQKLEPSAIIELFELDATNVSAGVFRFHAGTNGLTQDVTWQTLDYTRFPILATGFEYNGAGQLPRPKIQVSNLLSAVTALLLAYQDLLGAKFTRKRTLAKFLDAVNFPGSVNATADSTAAFPDEVFYIDRKSSENRNGVEFELAASFDLMGVQLPRRQIIQNSCPWVYRGGECGYTGSDYFTITDESTLIVGQDACGKRLASCKLRFGAFSELPFGSFPGADLYK